jgi:hypothetical protein
MSDEVQKNILTEIRARHEQDQRWRNGPSMICPHAHDDRGWLLSEIERLRASVEELETIRAAAQALIDYEDADTYDPAGKGWEYLEENLRAALEAKP